MSSEQTRLLQRDVIVIAGSVEGIDALFRLINTLPAAIPAVVVAVLHGVRPSDQVRLAEKSLSTEALITLSCPNHGDMPVHGRLYVAPVDSDLVFASSGALHLVARDAGDDKPLEADRLFKSAAAVFGSRVIGVVLSGGGRSGTSGMIDITAAGGIRIVQSPVEARYPAMPASALLEDHVQFSVMLDQMGQLLAALVAGKVGLGATDAQEHG